MKNQIEKKKLLMMTHRIPYPPNRGDRIRTWGYVTHLSAYYDIYLASMSDEVVTYDQWLGIKQYVKGFAYEQVRNRVSSAVRSLTNNTSISENVFHSQRLHNIINDWNN